MKPPFIKWGYLFPKNWRLLRVAPEIAAHIHLCARTTLKRKTTSRFPQSFQSTALQIGSGFFRLISAVCNALPPSPGREVPRH